MLSKVFQIVMLEKTHESPMDSKEIQAVNPKGNQPWIFIGRTIAEAEVPILWSPDAKSQLIGKDPDAGRDWKQKEKDDSPTQWTWICANSRRQWKTVEPVMVQSMESQRVRLDLALSNWTTTKVFSKQSCVSWFEAMQI